MRSFHIPTIAVMLECPVLDCNATVMFLPPASTIPCARMAPNFAITSSCLSPITLEYICLYVATLGHVTSFCVNKHSHSYKKKSEKLNFQHFVQKNKNKSFLLASFSEKVPEKHIINLFSVKYFC